MYVQKPLAEESLEVLHAFIRAHPFGILVLRESASLDANHLPFQLCMDAADLGVLKAHVAVRNPVWQSAAQAGEALAIFHGPQGYISPAWHPARRTHGKVAPSWNYAAVHAYGNIEVKREPSWLRSHLGALTQQQELQRPDPWSIAEAPADFITSTMDYIVGLELRITRLQGKFQASQQYQEATRHAIVEALRREKGAADATAQMMLSRKSMHAE